MPIFQQKLASSEVDAFTVTSTLDASSTLGSMLIAILVIDKNASSVDTITGFTAPVIVKSATSTTLAYSYKISDGTEQAITATWAGSGKDGRLWIGEVKDPDALAPELIVSDNSGGTAVKSLSTGATGIYNGSGIAIAAWSSDTGTNTTFGRNYTNDFIEQDYLNIGGAGHDYSGIMIAAKELNSNTTALESTFSTTGTGDQMCAVMLVIAAPPSVVVPVANIGHYWSAALDATATVKCRVPSGLSTVLEYSTSPSFASSSFTTPVIPVIGDDFIAAFNLTGLSATTQYYVRCVEDGVVDTGAAKFKTMAASGAPTSFEMVWSGDINTNVESVTMDNIVARDSDFLFINGDIHYADITVDDVDLYRSAFKGQFDLPKFKAMMQAYNTTYIWDDHDFGSNDSDATSNSKLAAASTFREYNPAPYLRNSSGSVEYTFDYGRVRFIMLDNRHDRVPENGQESILGPEQEAWLLGLLETTAADSNIKLVVVHTGVPWQSSTGGNDTWYGSRLLRTRIADKIWEVGLQDNILMMGGDAHMTAYNDGSDNTYDSQGRAGWPVYQSGGISRTGSVKGGPWSITPTQSDITGLYSVLSITDSGTEVTVTNTAYDSSDTQTSTHTFSTVVEAPVVPSGVIVGGQITRGQPFGIVMSDHTAGVGVEVWLIDGANEYQCAVSVYTDSLITATCANIGSPIASASIEIRPITTLGT